MRGNKNSFLYKLATKIEGHITIGKLTIHGDNAMHFGCRLSTKRFGFICFRLPIFCNITDKIKYGGKIRWMPLYLYFSPNGTPWASTFMIGGGKDMKNDKTLSKLRRAILGHNFSYDSENEDWNYKKLQNINNLL